MVKDHPEQATDDDRALAAITSHEDRWRAFGTLIDAAGGLEAAVRASYEIVAERKRQQDTAVVAHHSSSTKLRVHSEAIADDQQAI